MYTHTHNKGKEALAVEARIVCCRQFNLADNTKRFKLHPKEFSIDRVATNDKKEEEGEEGEEEIHRRRHHIFKKKIRAKERESGRMH